MKKVDQSLATLNAVIDGKKAFIGRIDKSDDWAGNQTKPEETAFDARPSVADTLPINAPFDEQPKCITNELIKGYLTMAYTMAFDFTDAANNTVRTSAADATKHLRGYKKAVGGVEVAGGVPIWFSVPYTEMFGASVIEYDPEYTIYIDSNYGIGSFTTIDNKVQSAPLTLGSSVTFKDGKFVTSQNGTSGTITLNRDDRSTKDFTVGLCAKVNGIFQVFCAFTLQPDGSICMEPKDEVLLCSGDVGQSGSVSSNTVSPGCKFPLDASNQSYALRMLENSFAITSATGGASVTDVPANENILMAFK